MLEFKLKPINLTLKFNDNLCLSMLKPTSS